MASKPKTDPSPLAALSEPDTLARPPASPPPPVSLPAAPVAVVHAEPVPEVVVVGGQRPIPNFNDEPLDPVEPDHPLDDVVPSIGVEARATPVSSVPRVPYVNPPKTQVGDEPPLLSPGAAGETLEPDGTVLFISKVPGFQVRLGVDAKDLYTFSGNNELRVKPAIASRLKLHHLYEMGHFYLGSEVVRSGDKYLVLKRDDPMAEERAAGKVLFYFPEKPTLQVMLPGVQQDNGMARTEYVCFSDHRAAVEPRLADILRRHTFFREGRIREMV